MKYKEILDHLPYKSSFRFVDRLTHLSEDEVRGEFTLRNDAYFYEDHFPGHPVTPGVILTEIMAQIGLVTLGIYLMTLDKPEARPGAHELLYPLLTSAEVSFHKMVPPGQTVFVHSKKEYFRFGKLKCFITMSDAHGNSVAEGMFSGLIKHVNQLVS